MHAEKLSKILCLLRGEAANAVQASSKLDPSAAVTNNGEYHVVFTHGCSAEHAHEHCPNEWFGLSLFLINFNVSMPRSDSLEHRDSIIIDTIYSLFRIL